MPTDAPLVNLEGLAYETDGGIGSRANLGLLVLRTDQTIEAEFRHLVPSEGVGLYHARLHNDVVITRDNLLLMEKDIAPATALFPPDVKLDVVGFGCTSGALTIGEACVAARVREFAPGVQVTDPVTAAIAAFSALGLRRVALLTPYLPDINMNLRAAFQQRGLDIPVMLSFNEADDAKVARISYASILHAIEQGGRSEHCDAVFVSCTSLRVAAIVAEAERRIGKPVTSSNHAMAWHMMRLAGLDEANGRNGRLYECGLSGRAVAA